MENYVYYCPARMIFGRGEEKNVGRYLTAYGAKRVLLHYGGGSIKRSGLYETVTEAMRREGIWFCELGGVKPNPRLSLVREGIALAKKEKTDFILAVGGGSVIDSAKAIAQGALTDDDIWEYYMDPAKNAADALPIGCVLTIPAAGSESSNGSVITDEISGFKRYTGGECVIPKFSILDPELTYTLPPYQTACGCSDILAHLMERYFTPTVHTDLTDRLLEATMKTVMTFGPMALGSPRDYEIRAEIMQAGYIAHNDSLNGGRAGDWASHDIEHELSGRYDIAHGAGLAIIFPAWMRYVSPKKPERIAQFGRRVLGMDVAAADERALPEAVIARMEDWYRRMGLPVRLFEAGITEDAYDEMAAMCVKNRGTVGGYIKLGADDIKEIYRLAK